MDDIVKELIEKSYSIHESLEFSNFHLDEDSINQIGKSGDRVLKVFPCIPSSCVPMTAMWVADIRDNLKIPVYAVTGSLDIDGRKIFGDESIHNKSGNASNNLDWDGHCWMIVDEYVCDISLFRTAYSNFSHPVLKQKVIDEFGKDRGLLMATVKNLLELGFKYTPTDILTDQETTSCLHGAKLIIKDSITQAQPQPEKPG